MGGKPKFKSKYKSQDSFYIDGDQIKAKANQVKIPNLGWVNIIETIRFDGKMNSAVISRTSDALLDVRENQTHIGIDLGLTNFATFSNRTAIAPPKPLHQYLRWLARLNRQLAKKQKGSNNFKKAKKQLVQLHAGIANIRRNFLHKLSTALTTNFSHIAVESLNISGMIKNKRLAKNIADGGWVGFLQMLQYKAQWYGCTIHVADRFFASSKTCSSCRHKKEVLALSQRIFSCESCGLVMDRDHNAAKKIIQQLPVVHREFTPAEMTALLLLQFGAAVTSIETSNRLNEQV